MALMVSASNLQANTVIDSPVILMTQGSVLTKEVLMTAMIVTTSTSMIALRYVFTSIDQQSQ